MPAAARAKARANVRREFWVVVSMRQDQFPSCCGKQAGSVLVGHESLEVNCKPLR